MHTTTALAGEVIQAGAPAARVAHATLFERIVERIHRYFRRMLRDPHEADECLQQTLVLLETSLRQRTYDPTRSFNAWMWLKARTVWAQWCRARERAPGPLPPVDPPARQDEQAQALERLDAARILEAVRERLGGETYEAFVLYYEGGLTQAEVAQALDRDRKTVRKRIEEAHELIARLLEPKSQPD